MGFFKKKKALFVDVIADGTVVYSGKWQEMPLTEEIILQKSVQFFDDCDPCYIHRNAVRVRLMFELEQLRDAREKGEAEKAQFMERMTAWTGLGNVTETVFAEKDA